MNEVIDSRQTLEPHDRFRSVARMNDAPSSRFELSTALWRRYVRSVSRWFALALVSSARACAKHESTPTPSAHTTTTMSATPPTPSLRWIRLRQRGLSNIFNFVITIGERYLDDVPSGRGLHIREPRLLRHHSGLSALTYADPFQRKLDQSGHPYCPPKSACGPSADGTWAGAPGKCRAGACVQ